MKQMIIIIAIFANSLFSQDLVNSRNENDNNFLNAGTEFVITNLPSINENGTNQTMKLFIFSADTTKVEITNSIGYANTLIVFKNNFKEVDLKSVANIYSKSSNEKPNINQVYQGKGILVNSEKPISIYAISSTSLSSEGYFVLPTNSLGKEYLINSVKDQSNNTDIWHPSQIAIIGNENRTKVALSSNVENKNINLNKGDVYLLSSNDLEKVLSNVIISSDKPIGVISGSYCSYLPYENKDCGFLQEMELPTSFWGSKYHLTPINNKNNNSYIIVTNKDDNTELFFNGESVYNFQQKGSSNTFGPFENDNLYISSDKPISVIQYTFSDEKNYPLQIKLIPIETYVNEFTFFSPSTNDETQNYLNLCYMSEDGTLPSDIEIGISNGDKLEFSSLNSINLQNGNKYSDNGLNWYSTNIKLEKDTFYKLKSQNPIGGYIYNSESMNMHFGFYAFFNEFNSINFYNLLTKNINFGEIKLNSNSTLRLEILENISSNDIVIKKISIVGNDKDLVSLDSDFNGFTIKPKEVLELNLSVNATKLGNIDANLQVEYININHIELIPIQASIILDYDDYYKKLVNEIDFGPVYNKKANILKVDFIENTSEENIDLFVLNLKGDNANNFNINNENTTFKVLQDEKQDIELSFTPDNFGKYNAFFEFELPEINRIDKIYLKGEYLNPIEIINDKIDFDFISIGNEREENIKVLKNISNQEITFDKISIIGENKDHFQILEDLDKINLGINEELSINIKGLGIDIGQKIAKLVLESEQMDLFIEVDLNLNVIEKCEKLTLIYPNGGENFNKNDLIPIRWCGVNEDDEVNIYFSSNNGKYWNIIAEKVSGLRYDWKVDLDSVSTNNLFKVEKNSIESSIAVDSITLKNLNVNNQIPFVSKNDKYLYLFAQKSTRVNLESLSTLTFDLPSPIYEVKSGQNPDIVYLRAKKSIIRFNLKELNVEKIYQEFNYNFDYASFNISNDESYIVVGDLNGNIFLFDQITGEFVNEYFTVKGGIVEVDVNYDNSLILTSVNTGIAYYHYFININSGEIIEKRIQHIYAPSYFLNNFSNDCITGTHRGIYIFNYDLNELTNIQYEKIGNYNKYSSGIIPFGMDSILIIEEYQINPNTQMFASISLFDIKEKSKNIISNNNDVNNPNINTTTGYNFYGSSNSYYFLGTQDLIELYDKHSSELKFSFNLNLGSSNRQPLKKSKNDDIIYFNDDNIIRVNFEKPNLMFFDNLGNNKNINAYDVSKISEKVISIESEGIVLRNYKTGRVIDKIIDLELEGQIYNAISFSPDDKYFAINYIGKEYEADGSFSPDSLLVIYDIEKKIVYRRFFERIPNDANQYASSGEFGNNSVRKKFDFSKDGKRIAFIYAGQSDNASVHVFDINNGEEIFKLENPREEFGIFVYLLNNGKQIIIDQKLYDVDNGELIFDFTVDQRRAVNTISDDEKFFVNITDNGDDKGNIVIWDIKTRRKVITIPSAGIWYKTGLIFNKNNSILGVMDENSICYYYLDSSLINFEVFSDQSDNFFTINSQLSVNHKYYNLFPNPANEVIFISDYIGSAKIINALGIEVWNGIIDNSNKIDISNLPSGYYQLILNNQTSKFIKY